jgi:hypothetical protein
MPRELYPESCETAVLQHYTFEQCMLAASLACYTSGDDLLLKRNEFLVMVRDRIDMDLQSGDY